MKFELQQNKLQITLRLTFYILSTNQYHSGYNKLKQKLSEI